MKVLKILDDKLEEFILIILLVCMVVLMTGQVISRYVFRYSPGWTEELTQYLFVWGAFLSASYCVKKRISIKIEQFINILSPRGKTAMRLIRHTLVFIFCVVMLPFSVTYVEQAIDSGAATAALGVPMYFIQSAPLVGFILLIIRVVQAWIREFKILFKIEPKSTAEVAAENAELSDIGQVEAIMEGVTEPENIPANEGVTEPENVPANEGVTEPAAGPESASVDDSVTEPETADSKGSSTSNPKEVSVGEIFAPDANSVDKMSDLSIQDTQKIKNESSEAGSENIAQKSENAESYFESGSAAAGHENALAEGIAIVSETAPVAEDANESFESADRKEGDA